MRTETTSATDRVPTHAVIDDWAKTLRMQEVDGFRLVAEGLPLIDKAIRYRRGRTPQIHAVACDEIDWAQIDVLYAALDTLQPSPVITLNRAVAIARTHGPAAAMATIEPLGQRLSGHFHFFGLKAVLLVQLGRSEEARAAFDRAIALANSTTEAAQIRLHRDVLIEGSKAADSVSFACAA